MKLALACATMLIATSAESATWLRANQHMLTTGECIREGCTPFNYTGQRELRLRGADLKGGINSDGNSSVDWYISGLTGAKRIVLFLKDLADEGEYFADVTIGYLQFFSFNYEESGSIKTIEPTTWQGDTMRVHLDTSAGDDFTARACVLK